MSARLARCIAVLTLPSWIRPRSLGPLLVRVAFGLHLMWSSDDLFDPAAQREFARYLGTLHVPLPLASAYAVHVTELFGGLCLLLGLAARPAALALAFNFFVALALALPGEPYVRQYQAAQLFAVAIWVLLDGPGSLSVDAVIAKRRRVVSSSA